MFKTIWQFQVVPAKREEFEVIYNKNGLWAQLFRKADGYLGTELFGDVDKGGSYVTVDSWRTEEDFKRFKELWSADYKALDTKCEGLTESEVHLTKYESL
jgi:heme-degrading monooxygenase HmoA